MNKKFMLLLPTVAAMMLAGCGPTTPAASSNSGTSEPTTSASSEEATSITGVTVTAAGDKTSLSDGEQVQLTAVVTGTGKFSSLVTWESSAESVATVSSTGLVTGVGDGEATITAKAKGDTTKSGTIKITVVVKNAAQRHSLYKSSVNLASATAATILDIQGVLKGYENYSNNAAVNAYIQEEKYGYWVNNLTLPAGVVVGDSISIVGAATYYGSKAKAYPCVNATNATVTKLTTAITADPLTLDGEKTFADSQHASINTGEVEVTAVDATTATVQFVSGTKTWVVGHNTAVSQNDAIKAKFDQIGVGRKITIVGAYWGDAKNNESAITLTNADQLTLGAEPVATSIAVSGSAELQSVKESETPVDSTYTAVITPSGAAQSVTWTVTAADGSATTAATITTAGVVTPAKGLSADVDIKVVATSVATPSVSGSKDVKVLAVPAVDPQSVTVTAAESATSVAVGADLQLSASVLPAEASQVVTWESSNTNVATVDSTGKVSGVLDGTTVITATASGGTVKGTFNLTVTNTITSLADIVSALSSSDSAIKTAAQATKYIVKGVVLAVNSTSKVAIVSDGTKAFEVYGFTNANIVKGNYVEITSTFKLYYNLLETNAVVSAVIAQTNDKPTIAAATAITTTDLDTLAANSSTDFAGQQNIVSNARISNSTLVVNGSTFVGKSMYVDDGFAAPSEGIWGTFNVLMIAHGGSGTQVFITGFTKNDPVAATGVTVSSAADSVSTGSTLQMSAVAAPVLSDQNFVWTVTATDGTATTLATIDSKGVLTAVAVGTVRVVATSAVTSTVSGYKDITITVADRYSYTFKEGDITKDGGKVTLGGIEWTASAVGYVGWDTNNVKGLQIGSGSTPIGSSGWTLTADIATIHAAGISQVIVNASMASSGNAKLTVTAGSTTLLDGVSLTTSSADYSNTALATPITSGTLTIKLVATAKAAYIKSIVAMY